MVRAAPGGGKRPLARRRFLLGVGAALTIGVLGIRWLWPARAPAWKGLRALADWEASVLAAALARILALDPESSARVVTRGIARIDALVAELPARPRRDLRAALFAFEWLPLGVVGRFASLDALGQDRKLESWERGWGWQRAVLGALKELSALGYYTWPDSWVEIGYGGPWVPASGRSSPFDERYTRWIER